MRKLHPASLVGTLLLLTAACAPGATSLGRGNPYRQPAQQACVGERVLRVQNSLTQSVEILQGRGAALRSVALLSPGSHTIPVEPGTEATFQARTAGSSESIASTRNGKKSESPEVRMDIQCRTIA